MHTPLAQFPSLAYTSACQRLAVDDCCGSSSIRHSPLDALDLGYPQLSLNQGMNFRQNYFLCFGLYLYLREKYKMSSAKQGNEWRTWASRCWAASDRPRWRGESSEISPIPVDRCLSPSDAKNYFAGGSAVHMQWENGKERIKAAGSSTNLAWMPRAGTWRGFNVFLFFLVYTLYL